MVSIERRRAFPNPGSPYLFVDNLYAVVDLLLRDCAVGDYRTYSGVNRFFALTLVSVDCGHLCLAVNNVRYFMWMVSGVHFFHIRRAVGSTTSIGGPSITCSSSRGP